MRTDGVEVLTARSGAEALDLLLSHDIALALVDVQMPEMDGFELAELMRGSERTRQVPIIFVTAGEHDHHRVFRGYDSGAVDFLYRPVDPRILTNKAGVFFELHRQRQLLQRELQERTETLRQNEMFAGVLSHDLRNPLGIIVTDAQILLHASRDELVRQVAARTLSSAQRMSRMVGDLLDVTRARLAGGIPVVRRRADAGAVVSRVVADHQLACPGRRIELTVEGACVGEWDPDRLSQVAANLVGNAFQHGDAGAPIAVRVDGRHASQVVLTVTSGGAIPVQVRATIFDPFSRGARTDAQSGLGLGLYIAQQIVLAHGGTIHVDVDNGRSTTFRVVLPRG
jgi:signal transduction histidine kinase